MHIWVCVYLFVRVCSLGLFTLQIAQQDSKILSEREKRQARHAKGRNDACLKSEYS